MLFDELEATRKVHLDRLPEAELEELLGPSALFPSKFEPPRDPKALEAERLIKEQATLYRIAETGEKHTVPPLASSRRKLKQQRKARREADAGPNWFHMKAPELTPELERDLAALRLRGHIDPKHFYRKTDLEKPPKFFEVGTLINHATEPVSHKLPKAARGKSLVEQLLEEDQTHKFSTRKWVELMKSKKKQRHSKARGSRAARKRRLGFH